MKIVIPTEVPSLNKWSHWHWAKQAKFKDEITVEIMATGVRFRERKKKFHKVTIISYRKKLLDPTNLRGGAKFHEDVLKRMGLIYDDSPEWIDIEVRQEKDLRNQRTEIEVTDV